MRMVGTLAALAGLLAVLSALCGCGQQQTGRYQITPGGALLDTATGAAYVTVGGNIKQWVLYAEPVARPLDPK